MCVCMPPCALILHAAEAKLLPAMRPAAKDAPPRNGQLSDALTEPLAPEDFLDLETNERAVLLCKARELYELLGILPSNLKNALDQLFGENGRVPVRPGCVSASVAPAFVSPLWAGAGGSGSSSSGDWCFVGPRPAGPARVGPGPVSSPQVAELPAAAVDDTHLKRTLAASLEGAREIVGAERYAECVRRLRRSEELVVASCLEAAEGLAALGARKADIRDRDKKEQLKAAKQAARDVLLWRCTGSALGLDSREALVRCFEETCRHTNCDENMVSQLTKGYRRIKEELVAGPRIASSREMNLSMWPRGLP